MKIGVSIGITLCVDPENRNFLRMGIDASDIDPKQDIEEQANAAVVAAIKVINILDDGLMEQVEDIASELNGVPTKLRDEITEMKRELYTVREKTLPNVINKVREMVVKVEELAGGVAEEVTEEVPELPVVEESAPNPEPEASAAKKTRKVKGDVDDNK